MTKKWSDNCSAKLKSFVIEGKVLNFFDENDGEPDTSKLIRNFFDYYYNSESDDDLRSHLKTASNRAKKACEFEEKDDLANASEEWRKIFGDDFPAWAEKRAAVAGEPVPVLGSCSHCKTLAWPFTSDVKVSIDAYVYNQSDTNQFGGLNSNGRILPAGLRLKYIARTKASGEFQYFWQVVNTGSYASNDLRGDFLLGKKTHWESTKYKGKHWIECFIVKNGHCIGRSGKFFVNIK